MDTDKDKDLDTDMKMDMNMDTDMETDLDTNMDTDMEMDTDTSMDLDIGIICHVVKPTLQLAMKPILSSCSCRTTKQIVGVLYSAEAPAKQQS